MNGGSGECASARDLAVLKHLSDSERAAWQSLWRDVDELAKRAAKQDKADDARDRREAVKQPKRDSHK